MKPHTINQEEKVMLALMAPSFIGFIIFFALPFALSLYLALVDTAIAKNFVGLANFKAVLGNEAFLRAITNTLLFLAVYLPLNTILPLFMALSIHKIPAQKQLLFSFIFLLPLIIPSSSMVTFWNALIGINGLVNKLFFPSAPVDWLNTDYARLIIIFIFIWKNAGYNMVFFLTGLNFIPREYYEFAAVEGAGAINILLRITIPSLMPSFIMVLIMSVINSFNSFKEIHLLAGNYPHQSIYMLQHYINNQFSTLNYQRLAAASYIISLPFVLIALFILRYQNKALGRI